MPSTPHRSPDATSDFIHAVLRERARLLAQLARAQDAGHSEARRFVEFHLAGERYGIEAAFVREVHPLKEFTELPGTPPFLLGIVNIRSSILPVVDIKKFFGLPDVGISDLNKIIIVQALEASNPTTIGILADVIGGVREIADEEIQSTLPTLEGLRADYFQGVTRERLILLDMAAVLSDRRILINDAP